MKNKIIITLSVLLIASHYAVQAQTAITDWNFDNISTIGFNPQPAASTGLGTAFVLGMDNNYPTPGTSTNVSDVLVAAGSSSSTLGANNQAWRIVGGSNTVTAANGWSSVAPIGTQGAQFSASTAGFDNIQISFDLETTKQGEAKLQLEYTTDGTTWNNAVIAYSTNPSLIKNNTTSANTVTGTYLQVSSGNTVWWNGITADLSAISGVNNNSNFGIRLVNASTGADNTAAGGGALNNLSGNWRFDNVDISGTPAAVPEPSSFVLAGCSFAALAGLRRLKNR